MQEGGGPETDAKRGKRSINFRPGPVRVRKGGGGGTPKESTKSSGLFFFVRKLKGKKKTKRMGTKKAPGVTVAPTKRWGGRENGRLKKTCLGKKKNHTKLPPGKHQKRGPRGKNLSTPSHLTRGDGYSKKNYRKERASRWGVTENKNQKTQRENCQDPGNFKPPASRGKQGTEGQGTKKKKKRSVTRILLRGSSNAGGGEKGGETKRRTKTCELTWQKKGDLGALIFSAKKKKKKRKRGERVRRPGTWRQAPQKQKKALNNAGRGLDRLKSKNRKWQNHEDGRGTQTGGLSGGKKRGKTGGPPDQKTPGGKKKWNKEE